MWQFILAHQVGSVITATMLFVAGVNAMVQPWDGFYNWLYRFVHLLLPVVQNFESRFAPQAVRKPMPPWPTEQPQIVQGDKK